LQTVIKLINVDVLEFATD